MKSLMLAMLIAPFVVFSQSMKSISTAISSGDVHTLSQYFDEDMDFNDDLLNKSEAIQEVTTFFKEHPPKSFKVMHQGTSKGEDAKYFIGNLNASNGNFRVYVYLKKVSGKTKIQELRFDQD